MTDMTMRGVTRLRQFIADYLNSDLPGLIDVARTSWTLQDFELPYPVRYDSYDPLTASDFPTIAIFAENANVWQRVDTGALTNTHKPKYAVRVAVWVRTPKTKDASGNDVWSQPEYDTALRLRDDMLSLVTQSFLRSLSVGQPGICMIDERSMSQDYMEPIKPTTQGSRWLAGGLISFEMSMEETVYEQPIGTVQTTDVTEALMQ